MRLAYEDKRDLYCISGDHAHLPETPRSMARRLVKGLSPVGASIVRRKLVMHEVMVSEVKKFHRCNSSAFQTHSVIGGRIVKNIVLLEP